MHRHSPRLTVVGTALIASATPTIAHGTESAVASGLVFPAVVAASVGASLIGGGFVLAVTGRFRMSLDGAVPLLLVGLGGLSVAFALDEAMAVAAVGVVAGIGIVVFGRDGGLSDCGVCADAALGAVTLHRALEGIALATLYAADAALGVAGAAVLAVHAAAETAAVGSLYATTRRYALGAVGLLQVGFVLGVVAGWNVVGTIPVGIRGGLLALVGGVLLAAGAREAHRRYASSSRATPA
ncbi:hypothetical protein [Haloplanus halobius]|uniref:hypothetical protein n=1 Tax=Haloplanus halobius TaxID=2934938 RepID=UPI00200C541E|nr:hypothetical protein [Haloplanus sp. XH21]